MEISGRSKEVWNRSETVWNCWKALESSYICWSYIYWEISRRSKEVWNRSETVWNCRKAAITITVWNCRKASISADATFIWKLMDAPKRFETGLKPSGTVGKQLYLLILHWYGNEWSIQRGLKQVWNCKKAAISGDPMCTKRSETGLKPSETVGNRLEVVI